MKLARLVGWAGKRTNQPTLEDRCDQYLQSLHCTTWGSAFWIKQARGRKEAVDWLATAIRAIDELG